MLLNRIVLGVLLKILDIWIKLPLELRRLEM